MHKSTHTYTTTKVDQMARDFLESLGALKRESNEYILGRKGQARHGKFHISYEKGVCLNSGVPVYAYAGVEIRHAGKTVYNHHGDSIERVAGKWEEEFAALPLSAKPVKSTGVRRRKLRRPA